MVKDRYEEIKKWQSNVFADGKKVKEFLDSLLLSEVLQFIIFLGKKNINIPSNILDEYAKTRDFI